MKRSKVFPILITIIITISSAILIYFYYENSQEKTIQVNNDIANLVKNDSEETSTDLKTIIHESQKTVVQIEAENENGQSIGSGFIFNDKGDIITNAHVVDGSHSIYVKTSDAKTYPAALLGMSKEQDIAVIRVPQLINRSSLQVDTSVEVEIGDDIIAVGSPLGFQNTVTTGIISGKNRSFSIDGGYEYKDVYQISASITNGNSGGPLIHLKTGKIIAVNSAGTKEGSMGFSIPLSKVMDLAKMWSSQAENQELNFDGVSHTTERIDPKQLEEDAKYLVNYFYESLSLRDYINAYALLGSNPQVKMSYQEFRSEYIHNIDITMRNISVEGLTNNRVKMTILTDNHIKKVDQNEAIEHVQSEFIVGYENDQLKILESTRKLLSTTNIEPTTNTNESEQNS